MKRSYLLCALFLLAIVLFMIVSGVVQDNRMKRARVNECVTKTMAVAGCKEITEENNSTSKKKVSESDAHYKVVLSENVKEDNIVREEKDSIKLKVKDATYQILETKVNGDQAEVTVCVFQEEHTFEMTLAYVLVNDEWTLENSKDSIRKLVVDGKECDIKDIVSFEKLFE